MSEPSTHPALQRPSRSLHGKVAIVTGAGAIPGGIGNGRAAAVLLAEDGCAVICVDLDHSLAQETVDMIEKDNIGTGTAVSADVTKAEDCQRVVDLATSKYGRLDILVNNVGIMGPKGTAVEVDMAAFMTGLEINVASMVQMAKYAIPAMIRNKGEHIYGMVYTPMIYGGQGLSDSERNARRSRSLLQTEGNGWDVGCAVRYLASDLSRWVTGVALPVDAGTTAATGIGMQGLHDSTMQVS
ncbi:hypothetical protein ETB97_005484 [Aspergillus alliaceus]|uniref:Uncharacterized protein n=1 Tax=Petromyces alliaceus TaxID=209559 RepID=A0A8H5ZYY3_PETAA|nr:hypothetical protein ETB97_005484 [Aspergillus burnettii]